MDVGGPSAYAAQRIHGVVQSYSWGSRSAIAELMGRPCPTDLPEAELWLGAHPSGPSMLETGVLLSDVIDRAPTSALGPKCVDKFGPRLPFLFKVLAAETALSLQAHPTLDQARAGFARENAAGIPINSPTRNYRDDNHKPELLVALTEFHALAGFRDEDRTLALLRALDLPELAESARLLVRGGLRDLFEGWLNLGDAESQGLVALVLGACRRYIEGFPDGDFVDEAQMVIDLGKQYPGDPGVLAAMLLNLITLRPGEGIYLGAGHLHAYLRGAGIEIMANSDNVLRGGMTTKYINRSELVRVLRFESVAPPIVHPEPLAGLQNACVLQYATPASEFQLRRVEIGRCGAGGYSVACSSAAGPQILLCTRGTCRIAVGGVETTAPDSSFEVAQGESIWIPAGGTVTIFADDSDSQVFIATTP
ncbi:mannose-6-phosphate isomerase, class I [Rhodococcus artemisiae]|uniref:mannose-6-phosphate isomerase, class I n=1 Tax=Rhodococcus artemisiae TaxID=714159 RepID=UPI0038B472DF